MGNGDASLIYKRSTIESRPQNPRVVIIMRGISCGAVPYAGYVSVTYILLRSSFRLHVF